VSNGGLVGALVLVVPGASFAQTTVAPGILLYEVPEAHVVVVELDHPDVSFEVTEPELRGSTASEIAVARGAVVALNGGPFSLEGFAPDGLAVGGGRTWAGSGDDGAHTLLAVDVDGCGGIYRATPWVARERWMYSAVAGTAIVTAEGVGVEPGGCTGTICEERAQSAVGLSADGRRMALAAADRATPREVGDLLAAHGAWVGMLLDGGSSTAMVVDGEVVNVLSDGVERRVASHMAVFSGRAPRAWDVRGIVRGQPVVDVEIRTFWDQRLDGRATVPAAGGEENDGLFQYMPMPFRNVRIVTADRCLFTGFTGPEDLRLWWAVEEGATCPPAECTRVADAWAVTEPACPGDPAAAAVVPETSTAAATCGAVSPLASGGAWCVPLILIGIAAAVRRRSRSGLWILLGLSLPGIAGAHGNEGEAVAPGIYRHEHPELGAHVVLAELDSPEVSVEVVGGAGAAVRPTDVALGDPALVVVQSGGPFSSGDRVPTGLTVSGGQTWAGTSDDDATPVLAFSAEGCGSMRPSRERTSVTAWIDAAVSGARELLRDGQVAAELDCADDLCDAAPRSAVGVGPSGHRLVLVVVDGPPGPGPGMTARAVAELLAAHGAYAAILLEGGASAALAIGGAAASSPSDGVERSVASVLALRSTPGAARAKIVGIAFGDTVGGSERIASPTLELRTLSGFSIEDAQTVGDSGGYYETIPVLERSHHLVVGAAGRDRTCLQTIDEETTDCGGEPCRWASVRLLPGPGTELGCPPLACGPPVEIEATAPDCGDVDGGTGGGGGGGGDCGCRVASRAGQRAGILWLIVLLVGAGARAHQRRLRVHPPRLDAPPHPTATALGAVRGPADA